ncbi:MAG: DNA translocase FtsK [Microscillaceae bacterium]|nr:DNA translocase FtsK [Microscillaceae bacterium]
MAKTVYKHNTYKNVRREENRSWVGRLWRFVLQDQRFQFILGVFLLISAFALSIAFLSYFFTGKADQSVVEVVLRQNIAETGPEVRNWLGLTGAVLAHVFIFKWFGLASFLLVPLVFILGWRLAFKTEIFPLLEGLKLAGFAVFWVSLLLGALFTPGSEIGFWAGGLGYTLASMVRFLLGIFTLPIILFLLLVFLVYFFQLPTQLNGNLWATLGKEFKNFQDKIGDLGPDKSKAKTSTETAEPKPGPAKARPKTVIKPDFSKDIILEINDSPNPDENIRKTKPPTYGKPKPGPRIPPEKDPTASLELEIDPITPLDLDETEDTPEEIKRPFAGKGRQAELDFEHKNGDPLDELFNLSSEETLNPPPTKSRPTEDADPSLEQLLSEENEALAFSTGSDTGLYDPTQELSKYVPPTVELLDEVPVGKRQVSNEELEANKDKIVETLSHYGIGISQIKATIGPTVTLYEIIPEAGVRISKIKNLEDDIALSLAALGIRIIAPIPGKGTIGIEVPNKKRELVPMRAILESEVFMNSDKELPIVLGKSITNEVVVADLAKMPHILIAGATGQGKSVGLNVFLTSLIYKKHPAQLKFVMVDPKKVELTLFNKIEKHFLAKLPNEEEAIITDTDKVVNTLKALTVEMDNRYSILKEAACRNIKEYNWKFLNRRLNPKKGHKFLPYIVLVIDELADLMMVAGKEVEQPIARLAQLARAIGIHLIVATQRPSVNVITGIIKANFPARLSFKVTSKVDSRTILDAGGAEQLVGMGDLLYSMGSEMIRLQCPFIDTHEVERVCDYINIQQSFKTAYELPEIEVAEPEGFESGEEMEKDVLFEEAARIVVMHQQGSTSLLQRRLKLGYNRAGRLIDQLEKAGIVGPFEGSKAREVLVPDEYSLERLLSAMDK